MKFKKRKLTYAYEFTIKYKCSQTFQVNNSRFNTTINPNCPEESLY